MAKTTKHIVGAGGGPRKKKGFPRRQKPMPKYPGRGNVKGSRKLPDRKPMPYYPETGSNERPRLISEKDKQAIIKIWEDRNRSNNNTKLNP
tara:strand:- start:93 stop:365 length:273 start_codon:yes stop_codon:yes gene_type:complete